MSQQARRWCFTSYIPCLWYEAEGHVGPGASNAQEEKGDETTFGRPEDIQMLLQANGCVHGMYQLETCPATGRQHIQGYARFSGAKRLGGLRQIFEAHWEVARGNEQANIAYCSKASTRIDGPWSFGDPAQPGKRKDIERAREIVQECGKMRKVVEEVNSYQAIKAAEIILKYLEPMRTWKPHVIWLHGSTGSGKTRWAFENCPDAYISGKDLRWWEGYDAHDDVIIDDFRADFCKFHELLRILDRYAYRIETKGGSRQLLAKKIIITCPYSPKEVYRHRSAEDVTQLTRRISEIRLMGDKVKRIDLATAPCFK